MTPSDIARNLLARINAPRGAVSVFAEANGGAGLVLRVWVNWNGFVPEVPAEFLGIPVIVEAAPRVVAYC